MIFRSPSLQKPIEGGSIAQGNDPGPRLAELIGALSLATDLGSGQPMERALRRCLLAVRLGEALGLRDDELRTTYYVALLQYVGCTTEAHELAAVWGDEVAAGAWFASVGAGEPVEVFAAMFRHLGSGESPLRRARMLATALANMPRQKEVPAAHCEVAQRLAERLGMGPDVQSALGQVYERWDGKGPPRGLKGDTVALPVRVVKLAQDAETFHRLGGVEVAVTVARRRAGAAHDPGLVERFCREAPRLFDRLEAETSWEAVLDAEPGARRRMSETEFDVALRAMADFADLKSPYLTGHSSGVAALAAEAARGCRLPETDTRTVWRAGLLHDLGRVGVSAGLWGKTGPLTESERERVRLHPYYTERVLARPEALAHLGALAGLHHERLDGSGYHRGAAAASLSFVARLLAAADVYHALTEPRPHRPALPPEAAAEALRGEARAGRIDGEAAQAVLAAAGHRARPARREWPAGLTDREVDVLRLVARGLSNREMAARLTISKETVNNHVRHIYDKIDVSTRAAATLFAMRHDLLGGPAPARE